MGGRDREEVEEVVELKYDEKEHGEEKKIRMAMRRTTRDYLTVSISVF